jgi:hypothetical protein
MKEQKEAVRAFLAGRLDEAGMREASGLIAKFVAAAVTADRRKREVSEKAVNDAFSSFKDIAAKLRRREQPFPDRPWADA